MMKSRQNNERTDPKKGRTSAKSRTRSGKDLLADLNISASTGKVTQRPKPKTALPRVKTSAQEPKERKAAEPKVIFGGRLGEYKYYDMDQVIAAVLDRCESELH